MNEHDIEKEVIKKDLKMCSNMTVELLKQKYGLSSTTNEAEI